MKKIILTITALLSMTTMAYALNNLQLDIAGGSYNKDGATVEDPGTIISNGDVFNLYALVKNFETRDYFISASVVPSMTEQTPKPNLGSFIFGGQTINVTGDMIFGTPPIEAPDNKDLPSHGIFDTYFKEFTFTLDSSKTITAYNSQERAEGLTNTETGSLYYQMFAVDTSNLVDGYEIHFDLYTKQDNGYLDFKAPFSHDAASHGTTPPPVPEPGTIVLLGAGFLGLAAYGRKRIKK